MKKIDYNKLTEEKNKKFAKASKARKRVMIAKDVLAQLEAKRFVAKPGTFAALSVGKRDGVNAESEVCNITAGQKCNVCGIGALFVSAVEFADKLKIGELEYKATVARSTTNFEEDDVFCYLRRFFDQEQICAIESAFEMGGGVTYDYHGTQFFKTVNSEDYEFSPNERMRLIMENIVVHKGTFNPHVRPEVSKFSTPGYRA